MTNTPKNDRSTRRPDSVYEIKMATNNVVHILENRQYTCCQVD